jgi:hypothetical protein
MVPQFARRLSSNGRDRLSSNPAQPAWMLSVGNLGRQNARSSTAPTEASLQVILKIACCGREAELLPETENASKGLRTAKMG